MAKIIKFPTKLTTEQFVAERSMNEQLFPVPDSTLSVFVGDRAVGVFRFADKADADIAAATVSQELANWFVNRG